MGSNVKYFTQGLNFASYFQIYRTLQHGTNSFNERTRMCHVFQDKTTGSIRKNIARHLMSGSFTKVDVNACIVTSSRQRLASLLYFRIKALLFTTTTLRITHKVQYNICNFKCSRLYFGVGLDLYKVPISQSMFQPRPLARSASAYSPFSQ